MSRPTDLGRGFLRRVRTATVILGSLGVLFVIGYAGVRPGLAALTGLALSVSNLALLEQLFTRMLRPGGPGGGAFIALALLLKLSLLLGGTALALGPMHLPAVWFLAGFTFALVVILLKVLGMFVTGTQGRQGGWRLPDLRSRPPVERRRTSGPSGRTPGGILVLWLILSAGLAASPLLFSGGHGGAWAQTGETTESLQTPPASGTEGVEGGAEGGHGEHPPELPNLILILYSLFPGQGWARWLFDWQNPIYAGVVLVFLCGIAVTVYRRRTMIPGKLQNAVELIFESFANFILGILGPRGKEFIPFLGTLFLYIWLNNLQGLIPFLKSPTSVFNTTIALGICVFSYVQYTGVTKLGLGGYLHHMMGSPVGAMGWAMVPLMLPLHLIEEVAKPISLSLRLFGNIMGEDVLLGVFAGLGVALLAFMKLPLGVPLHLPFIFLALLLSTIQALVFTLLTTIYFLQMLPHEHEEGEAHGH